MSRHRIAFLIILASLALTSFADTGMKLKAKVVGNTVTLSWVQGTVPSGAQPVSANNVYRGTTSGGETLLASPGLATGYVDSTVVPGGIYYFQVTALNQCNGPAPTSPCESKRSSEVGPITVPNPVAPNAPTGVTATTP